MWVDNHCVTYEVTLTNNAEQPMRNQSTAMRAQNLYFSLALLHVCIARLRVKIHLKIIASSGKHAGAQYPGFPYP